MTRAVAAVSSFSVVAALYLAFQTLDWGPNLPEAVAKAGLWVVPCLLITRLVERGDYARVLEALGLSRHLLTGVTFGIVCALPMFVPLAGSTSLETRPLEVFGLIAISWIGPFSEEVLFRGFLFRGLVRRAHWPARTAVLASALAFGLAHFANVDDTRPGGLVSAIGEVGVTTLGGILFAWIVLRWDSLWPAVSLHAMMNLSWDLFGARGGMHDTQSGAMAIGTGPANLARLASVVLAVYLTIRLRRSRKAELHHGDHGGRFSQPS